MLRGGAAALEGAQFNAGEDGVAGLFSWYSPQAVFGQQGQPVARVGGQEDDSGTIRKGDGVSVAAFGLGAGQGVPEEPDRSVELAAVDELFQAPVGLGIPVAGEGREGRGKVRL